MKIPFFSLLVCLSLLSCQTGPQEERTGAKEEPGNRVSDLIRNPASLEQTGEDSVPQARIRFESVSYDFGTIKEGADVTHAFVFTNTGKIPLLIGDARSTCGCTVAEYPKQGIEPGQTDSIRVVFRSKGKSGKQIKEIYIKSNTNPSETILYLSGQVK